MTAKSDAGYGRPPKATQWKKGQCGNPRKLRPPIFKANWRIIEAIFSKEAALITTPDGSQHRGTVFEAISWQLYQQAMGGSRKAFRILQKYQAFAKTKPEYQIVGPQDRSAAAAAEAYSREMVRFEKEFNKVENLEGI
jgi:hypothetical protein